MPNNRFPALNCHCVAILDVTTFYLTLQYFPQNRVDVLLYMWWPWVETLPWLQLASVKPRADFRTNARWRNKIYTRNCQSPNLNSANIYFWPLGGHFAKYNSRQIFRLYGICSCSKNHLCSCIHNCIMCMHIKSKTRWVCWQILSLYCNKLHLIVHVLWSYFCWLMVELSISTNSSEALLSVT